MKAIMVMYDTLCRSFLGPYGNDWVKTPSFNRLADNSVTFERNYVCSLPCMPARRDLHNSRVNFLQRDWGPLEPFDDSMPEELKKHGIYTALVSDHYHYWEDGGCTYHSRYNSWICHRGQEGDFCRADRSMVKLTAEYKDRMKDPQTAGILRKAQDQANRSRQVTESDMPQARTFADGLAFLEENADTDNWFLQIETFDPHEPFFTQPDWQSLYPELAEYTGNKTDWPGYDPVRPQETQEDIAYVRRLYAALTSMCDFYLGKVLDCMDKHDLWKDTMLIVNTDHGFLLGEHDWWGKTVMPAYEEISHTPLFIYAPVSRCHGQRRSGLTCPLDLPVTLLDFFGVPVPDDMQGHSLLPLIRENKPVRDSVLFGFHASHVAVTDGQYTYFRAPLAGQSANCFDYTLMPTHMREFFSIEDLRKAEFADPLPNSKGCRVLKVPAKGCYINPVNFGTKLYDVEKDPRQTCPVDDAYLEARMTNLLVREMKKADAPLEQYIRLGLPQDREITSEDILSCRIEEEAADTPDCLGQVKWTKEARNIWRAWAQMMPPEALEAASGTMLQLRAGHAEKEVTADDIVAAVKVMLPPEQQQQILYFMMTVARAD